MQASHDDYFNIHNFDERDSQFALSQDLKLQNQDLDDESNPSKSQDMDAFLDE